MCISKRSFLTLFLFWHLGMQNLVVDAQTLPVSNSLSGKVICGYQGWFNCYEDGSPVNSWRHWAPGNFRTRDKRPSAGNVTFEAYPDVSEYPSDCLFQTGFDRLGNGPPARLFSSNKMAVIDLHFSWMQKYGIDGIALQRFLGETKSSRYKEQRDSVTVRVRHSAEKYGRIYYLMYDMSADDPAFFQNDVLHLERDLKVFSSPNYVHQDGKPVICIWGFGFNHRLNAPEASLLIINWLKAKGYYVIGGVPTNWQTGTIDSYSNYSQVYQAFDMISPWSVGRFKNIEEADQFKTNHLIPDKQFCKLKGIAYQPVVFPGFAWSNWNGGKQNQISRDKGNFLWRQILNIKSLGFDNLYVAMFDEYDEGTAICKMADSYFSTPVDQYFLTSSADGSYISSDFYLRLVGKATRVIKDEIPLTDLHEVPYQVAPVWFRTSFEPKADALPKQFLITDSISHLKNKKEVFCELSENQASSGRWSLKVSGSTSTSSALSSTIFSVRIQVSENTNLSYRIFPQNSQGRFVLVELTTTDGVKFSAIKSVDQLRINEWNDLEFNLGNQLKGKEICRIAVGYNETSRPGFVESYIDDFSITDEKPENTK